MATVNLIPDNVKLDLVRNRRKKYWLAIIVLTVSIITAWSSVKYYACVRTEQTVIDYETHSQQVKQKIAKLSETKAKLDLLEEQFTLLAELDQFPDHIRLAGFLARKTPDTVYLNQLSVILPDEADMMNKPKTPLPKEAAMFQINASSQQDDEADVPKDNKPDTKKVSTIEQLELQLNGLAQDYKDVADYMDVLRESRLFHSVRMIRSGRDKTAGEATLVEFEIICELKQNSAIARTNYANIKQTENL